MGAIGKGMPHDEANVLSMYADTPANVSWASEICPVYPVTTTRDNVMTPVIMLE